MEAVSGVGGHESGFDLSLSFSRWASDSAYSLCSQMTAPWWQMEGHPRHCTGCLLLPELPHGMEPPAGCLTQLDYCWRCVRAGSALLAACLPYSSELCPSPLLAWCATASGLYWVFSYHNIQCRCYAKQPVWLSMLNSVETQLNKSTTIIPGGWLEPQDTGVKSCGFYAGRCRFQPLESSYPTDNN